MASPLDPSKDDPSGSASLGVLLEVFLDPAGPDVTEVECADGVLALDRAANRVEAARCAAVDRFDAKQCFVPDGMRGTVAWLRARTELAPGAATAVVMRARGLRFTPLVADAFRDGAIGVAKVDALADARVGVGALFAAHEAEIVEEVTRLTVRDARYYLSRWRARALASIGEADDGTEPDPEDLNRFHCSETYEGRHKLDGDLDQISGAMVNQAIDARIDQMFRSGAISRSDQIPRAQLAARALVDLIIAGAGGGFTRGRPRPSVTVRVDYGDLLGLEMDGPGGVWERTCETGTGSQIPRSTAQRLMCNADVTAVLTITGLGEVIDPIGAVHTNRYPSANERAALAVRDGGCVYPGCDAPVAWTDAHHIDEWDLHHVTSLDRLVLLCRFHHHAVHEGRHRLDRSADGHIAVVRPNGTLLHSGPHTARHQIIETPGRTPMQTARSSPTGSGTSPPIRPPTRFADLADQRTQKRRVQDELDDRRRQAIQRRMIDADLLPCAS